MQTALRTSCRAARSPGSLVPAHTRRLLACLASAQEPAREHIRNAIQLLSNLLDLGTLGEDDRREVRAAIRRLWTALREIERGNL